MLQHCMLHDYVSPSRSVRSFGTEGRKAHFSNEFYWTNCTWHFGGAKRMLNLFLAFFVLKSQVPEIPPSSEIYDFIIFRGQDLAHWMNSAAYYARQTG